MRRSATIALLAALALLSAAATARAPAPAPAVEASDTTEGTDGDAEAGASPQPPADSTTGNAAQTDTPDVFVPSVEVSEDLSVAFPVDI